MGKDQSADGLRGLASLNVFFAHFFLAFFPLGFEHFFPGTAQAGADLGLAERLLSAPIISVLWNGKFAVCIFFVLSGYVLTKPYVATGDLESIRSRAARRYIRLGIPVLASTLFAYLFIASGAQRSFDLVPLTRSAWLSYQGVHSSSFFEALKDGAYGSLLLGRTAYNPVLWTMRIEFYGSMLIFAYRALSWRGGRCWIAVAVYTAVTMALSPQDWPYYSAFLLGSHIGAWKPLESRCAMWALIVVGLFLGGIDSTPKFAFLAALPFDYGVRFSIFSVLGSACVVYAVRSGAFSALLKSRAVQFMGRISYSFYLIHLTLILSIGCWLFESMRYEHGSSRITAMLVSLIVTLPITIALAWAFELVVDRPTILLSKKLFPSIGGGRARSSEAIKVI